jgi:anti-sigma-K factor RskA
VNIKEYISSGIVESYVLGLASEQERSEFEHMCSLYPEVREARNFFEMELEKQASKSAISPPEEFKQKLFEVLKPGEKTSKFSNRTATSLHSLNWLKYALAACFILLAGSIYWNISLYNKNEQLKNTNSNLENDVKDYSSKLAEIEKDAKMLQNPNIKMAALEGTQQSPQSFVTVYWDTTSKDVFLMINNLPQPASDKQYQLWALLNGEPIDLGVFEMKKDKMLPIVQMKNAHNVQAFAITLEKKGGNSAPSMDAMYVKGEL